MRRPAGFASYVLSDIRRLTIVRISCVGHSAYGNWSFYLNGYHHILPSLKSGLEELLAAQKQITEESAPIMKVGAQSIQKVLQFEPLQKIRFAPDKHNAIRIVPFVRGENLFEIEISSFTNFALSEADTPSAGPRRNATLLPGARDSAPCSQPCAGIFDSLTRRLVWTSHSRRNKNSFANPLANSLSKSWSPSRQT